MENNCNNDCVSCESCISLDKSNNRVKITCMGEGIGIEYWCEVHQRYMPIKNGLTCGTDYLDKNLVIVSENGIQRTRGNKQNVNRQ